MKQLDGAPIVGMIGGGQLARMTAEAATALGVGFRVLAATNTDPAAQVVRECVMSFMDYCCLTVSCICLLYLTVGWNRERGFTYTTVHHALRCETHYRLRGTHMKPKTHHVRGGFK